MIPLKVSPRWRVEGPKAQVREAWFTSVQYWRLDNKWRLTAQYYQVRLPDGKWCQDSQTGDVWRCVSLDTSRKVRRYYGSGAKLIRVTVWSRRVSK